MTGTDLRTALEEVDGCFQAAMAEGLRDAIGNRDVDRLIDLIERRLMFAQHAAAAALAQSEGDVDEHECPNKDCVNGTVQACPDVDEAWSSLVRKPCPDCNKAPPQILGVDHSADGDCIVEGFRHTDGTIEVTSVTNTPKNTPAPTTECPNPDCEGQLKNVSGSDVYLCDNCGETIT